jgi:hypothetical protein
LKDHSGTLSLHSFSLTHRFARFFVEMLLAAGLLGATPLLFAG